MALHLSGLSPLHRNVTVCERPHFISFYGYCQTVDGEWLYQEIQQTKFLFM